MTVIFTEGFESDGNGVRYTTSVPEFSDGSRDFFIRTDGSDITADYSVLGVTDAFFFAAQDIDGEVDESQQTLSFTNIDISGFTNLTFSIDLAEDDAGSGDEDWDLTDFFQVEAQIDGGDFDTVLAVESIPDGDAFNAVPAIDTDFDGDGDGTELTDTFQTFTVALPGEGSILDLRLTFGLNAGDEDIAIDNLVVAGDAVVPQTPLISEFQPNPEGLDPAHPVRRAVRCTRRSLRRLPHLHRGGQQLGRDPERHRRLRHFRCQRSSGGRDPGFREPGLHGGPVVRIERRCERTR